MNRIYIHGFLYIQLVLALLISGCATSPDRPPRRLSISCRPEATVTLECSKFRSPLLLGVAGEKRLSRDRIRVANSLIVDPALSKGKPDASTEILLEELVNVTKVTLQVQAQTDASLYAKRTLTLPPWNHDIDLGLPAQVSRSEKIGLDFALPGHMDGFRLLIQNQELDLPAKLELTEGSYVFQLRDQLGTTFSGLLQLYNSEAEFVRFAFVPVFQKINAVELKEIADRKREPRLYTTRIEGKSTVLANVWLGSRTSTAGVVLGSGKPRNIEVIFSKPNATLLLDNESATGRFEVTGGQKHYLTINIPGKDGAEATIYGLLDVPAIARIDTALTSFEIILSEDEITQVLQEHKVVKQFGSYQPPERPEEKLRMYELILGERMPRGMETIESKGQ